MLKWAKHQPQGRHFQNISTFSDMNGKNFDRLRTTNQLLEKRKLSTIHPRRHSLTGHANKENFGIYFARSPFGTNNNLNALQDLSNTKTPQRQEANSTPLSTRNRNMLESSKGRFSDDFVEVDDGTPLTTVDYYCKDIQEESLSSSQMGDKTLDRMLDAIIESARKEVKSIKTVYQQSQEQIPIEKDNEIKDSTLYGDDTDASIHEMEVRTPTHLKRQRVVRRKNPKVPSENTTNRTTMKEKPLIGLTLPNGIPSPDTPNVGNTNVTPNANNFMFVVENDYRKCNDEMTRSSTPTIEEAQSIKRCLSFSSASDDDDVDYSAAKRGSVASSNASSTAGDYLCSGRTSRSSQNSLKLVIARGSLELSASIINDKLNVHVIRCRDLQRPNGSTALNAYVKVALILKSVEEQEKPAENIFQRTAVHRHSSRPYFDHSFHFNLNSEKVNPNVEDRLQLAVWHRDRRLKRSEFLGCLSFPLLTLLNHPIHGIFKLQSRTCLNNPHPIVPQPAVSHTQGQTRSHIDYRTQQPINDNFNPKINTLHPQLAHLTNPQVANQTHPSSQPVMTTIVLQKSEDEDVISIDSMTQVASMTNANGEQQPMVLSKKALHQRDADENLFLRFLELDPPTDSAASATNPPNSGGFRRLSVAGKPIGRTPFTMTKKLIRTAERGFGFSIVWTHPPRVEKVEAGLSADRSGILPGDYVIFVDKHNVVTMPEADVLNLIRSQGTTLTLEIFRRSGSGGSFAPSTTGRSHATTMVANGKAASTLRLASAASDDVQSTATTVAIGTTNARRSSSINATGVTAVNARPSTACSGTSSIEAAKRRLNLPQVTFSKESIVPITDNRRRILLQLINREQNFIAALHFGMQRFVQPLQERKDLISPTDHRILFQNIDELLRISEDILEQLCNDDQEPQMNFASRVYLSKTTAICAAYKKYCNGIKRADCVLVNKSRQTGSDFVSFITEPQIPRKRPDLTMFIHRPLQHFREVLKLMQLLASNCHVDTEEHKNFSTVIGELQAAYREITVSSGLMEPLCEGRPLLTLQDLESRMVFTKCKPFTLAVQGRQWIFGGDLSRVEGRSVKPYWTLLFSDIIVFAKVSRDRVLFITEEPIPIANIVDSCFHMRKKTTEFRLTVDPNGRLAESPTGYCAPDLTRTPKKSTRRKSLVLRAPSLELKAVWQNLLQRQIFLVNAALGSTPLSSPLDSPDVLNTLVPLSDIGVASASIGSIKLSSMDSINIKNQQQYNRLNHNSSDQIGLLIDEKCRILNKTGTPKSSALHLANWMKGQLDKQQEHARLAAVRSRETISHEDEHLLYSDSDYDERITYWTRQQLEKRTKELNLAKEDGSLSAKPNFGGKRLSGVEELSMSDAYSEDRSVISQSHSTTSDSQITVRSSPIVLDKLAVCRHCHKNCQQASKTNASLMNGLQDYRGELVCNSLKVQHSQASPNRCCKLSSNASPMGSLSSMSSSTITGDQHSERSSKVVASSSRRETGDTESDVALITDDLSQSEATDDSAIGQIPSSSSGNTEAKRRITHRISELRVLNEISEKIRQKDLDYDKQKLMNGHWSGSPDKHNEKPNTQEEQFGKPGVTLSILKTTKIETESTDKTKTTVTISESSKIGTTNEKVDEINHDSKKRNKPLQSPKTYSSSTKPMSELCNCECKPADFENTTLSPDECEHQTCKIIESPRQSPKLPRGNNKTHSPNTNPHKNCRCVCENIDKPHERPQDADADAEDLSLMLIGLAQITPATRLFSMKGTPTSIAPSSTPLVNVREEAFVPTIAVVPPTPEATLSKTVTNVWDNTSPTMSGSITTSTAQKVLINNVPRQAVVENILDDSCDESPIDEEPPYHPMTTALRRFGTMSSLEKLPSDDRMEDDELGDFEDEVDNVSVVDEYESDCKGTAMDLDSVNTPPHAKADDQNSTNGFGASTSVHSAAKMSFFEESRAFIDKYLGRWNQESESAKINQSSELEEQMDECTSGGTSGEELWGTPTSGGDNDDMQLLNSDNTHSSPTKSGNSLNDDDETELMMDELLMAPPMTVSTIRGLLPRRRLEPLFEEETESDEEKTQQESEELKKGETTTKGRYLEDSTGSSSSGEEDIDMEEEGTISSGEERLMAHLQTKHLGPRPLLKPTEIPTAVLKASSCEYLLEHRTSASSFPSKTNMKSQSELMTPHLNKDEAKLKLKVKSEMLTSSVMSTTMTLKTINPEVQPTNSAVPMKQSTSSTTYKESNIIKKKTQSQNTLNVAAVVRSPATFVAPPPPPRRLLLTQTNLSGNNSQKLKESKCQQNSGVFADAGFAVDASGDADCNASIPYVTTMASTTIKATSTTQMMAVKLVACNTKSLEGKRNPPPKPKRQSTTIIETSLLGTVVNKPISSSSITASRTNGKWGCGQHQETTVSENQVSKIIEKKEVPPKSDDTAQARGGCGLSPRLEMRLALNHDILDDEDLICYDPGPDLTSILGHDLSTFRRLTGRDLLNRSNSNRLQQKEAVISFSPQQRNSKMDTPTVNRRPRPNCVLTSTTTTTTMHSLNLVGGSARVAGAPQLLQPNRNTWSSSASVALSDDGSTKSDGNNRSSFYNNDVSKLSDLEILAKREMIYCKSQLKSGLQAKTMTAPSTNRKDSSQDLPVAPTTNTTTAVPSIKDDYRSIENAMCSIGKNEMSQPTTSKESRMFNFLKRRNSEIPLSSNCSQASLHDSSSSGTPVHRVVQISPRKDNDKPSLNRRLWKQITKRRRANSVSEIVA